MSGSTSKPKVGVFITTYNTSKFVAAAIDSLSRQTWMPDWVVVVDDASTDNSVKIAKDALLGRPFLSTVIVNENNLGPSASRNIAIRMLLLQKCDIIAQLDSDDFYYPTKIEKSVAALQKYPNIGLIYSDYDTLDIVNNKTYTEFKSPYSYEFLEQNCIISTNSVYRADVFAACGMFNEQMVGGEDYELYMRIAKKFMIYHIPEPLFAYRLHGKNLTLTKTEQVINNVKQFKQQLAASR
jgi:glycosyltransferase involved in cell wall biosynthesis